MILILSLRETTHKDIFKGYDVRMSDGVSYIRTTAQQEGQVNGKPQCLLSWWLPGARLEHPYLTHIYARTYDTKILLTCLAVEVWQSRFKEI